MYITSLQNPRVKHIVKLREDKRQRQRDGLMLVEGCDEIALAVSAGHTPQTLLTAPEIARRQIDIPAAERVTVSRAVFEKMSYRENPDGWLGVFPIPKITLDNLKPASATVSGGDMSARAPLVIIAESVEKPGNLGAILRTADAAGADAVIVCGAIGTTRSDVWNPNVVRASRGAVFSVPVVEGDHASVLEWLKKRKMRLLAASPSASEVYSDVDLTQPLAIAVGAEDKGLSDFWLSNADVTVKIPMRGKVNSLNVSLAAALIVYEAVRQRSVA